MVWLKLRFVGVVLAVTDRRRNLIAFDFNRGFFESVGFGLENDGSRLAGFRADDHEREAVKRIPAARRKYSRRVRRPAARRERSS